MPSLSDEYLSRTNGDRVEAATLMARDLMRGDPMEFKAGYTAGNAALAVAEAFELSADDSVAVRQALSG